MGHAPFSSPAVFAIAGPNGAGKTTCIQSLLPESLGIVDYLNMDAIAAGLSPFDPKSVEAQAGRLMLTRMNELAERRKDFVFEATLSGRSFATRLAELKNRGYAFHLIYVWLRSPELAVQRVRQRVAAGGHHVPDEVVRRRFGRSMRNFLDLYRPMADFWFLCDNSMETPQRIAAGRGNDVPTLYDKVLYESFLAAAAEHPAP